MKLSDKQLDELVNVWFNAARPAEQLGFADADGDDEARWRYRMTKVLEALEKITNEESSAPSQAEPEQEAPWRCPYCRSVGAIGHCIHLI